MASTSGDGHQGEGGGADEQQGGGGEDGEGGVIVHRPRRLPGLLPYEEEEDDEEELNDVVEVGTEAVLPSRPSKDGFARLDGHLRKNARLVFL